MTKEISLLVLCFAVSVFAHAEEPAPGKQVEQKLEFDDGTMIGYHLSLPKDYEPSKSYPFMLFLHGRGESNGPLSLVKKWGPPRLVDAGHDMPFIIASPQCPKKPARWSDETQQSQLKQLIAHLEKDFSIDENRMYLTGLSMGGYGSWSLAANMPGKFAAMIPVCGAAKLENAKQYVDLPVWVWHGTEDGAVPFDRSTEIVEAIKKHGGEKIRFTALEHIGHNSWSAAYATPEIYSWLLKHSNQKATVGAAK